MDKLIELLDLYRRENKTEELFWEPWTLVPLTWKDFIMLNRVMIISKEYWFIKWLVENDKIDRPKVWLKIKDLWDEYWWFGIYSWIHIECLLMLLAIQDEPIKILIEILKTEKQYTEEEQELLDLDYWTWYTKKFVK